MSAELKPCPFCGGEPLRCQNYEGRLPEAMIWVLCKSCHASPGDFPTEERAYAAWNARAEGLNPTAATAEQIASITVSPVDPAWAEEAFNPKAASFREDETVTHIVKAVWIAGYDRGRFGQASKFGTYADVVPQSVDRILALTPTEASQPSTIHQPSYDAGYAQGAFDEAQEAGDAGQLEPVAWRTRSKGTGGSWFIFCDEENLSQYSEDERYEVQPLYATPPKCSETEQIAEIANCSEAPANQYEAVLAFLTDMDRESMPNEKRALILASMMMRLTDEDRAWAMSVAQGLPPMPEVPAVTEGWVCREDAIFEEDETWHLFSSATGDFLTAQVQRDPLMWITLDGPDYHFEWPSHVMLALRPDQCASPSTPNHSQETET